jgi:hemoglobin
LIKGLFFINQRRIKVMHRIKRIALAACLLTAISATAAAQGSMSGGQETMKKSLYERLGGIDAIKAVVGEFAGRVLADDRINKKFAKTDASRLTLHLVEQICAATGGPCKYTGQDMKTAHKNMKVTEGEFNALVEDLVGALDKFNVPEQEKNDLLGILGPLKAQIVEVNSADTGTPLPPNFKPAPKLSKEKIDAGPTMKSKM